MNTPNPSFEQENATGYQKWEPLMNEWRESGLSAAEWVAQREDITYDQFRNARRHYFPEDMKKKGPVNRQAEWSALAVELPSSSVDLYIQDCRIEILAGFDKELLRELLEVLRHED